MESSLDPDVTCDVHNTDVTCDVHGLPETCSVSEPRGVDALSRETMKAWHHLSPGTSWVPLKVTSNASSYSMLKYACAKKQKR